MSKSSSDIQVRGRIDVPDNRQFGDAAHHAQREPGQAQPEIPLDAGGEPDALARRIGAALVDLLVVGVLLVIVGLVYHQGYAKDGQIGVSLHGSSAWVWTVLALSYYSLSETVGGQTVGKRLFRVRVVSLHSAQLSAGAVAIRTLLRIVDFLPVFYLVGMVTIIATGRRQQRLGDLAAGTSVSAARAARAEEAATPAKRSLVWIVPVGLAAVGVVVSLALAPSAQRTGQSGTSAVNLERQIESLLRRYTGDRPTVSCPRALSIRKGLITNCTATATDGSRATVRVEQTGSSGNVAISSSVVHTLELERTIANDASRRLGFSVAVKCPTLIEATRGLKVRCRAADDTGTSAPVEVTITDARGSFTYSIPRGILY